MEAERPVRTNARAERRSERVADLYRCYVSSAQAAFSSMLALLPNDRCRADFLELNRVMSQQDFSDCLEAMANDPERRSDFEAAVRKGGAKAFAH